MTDTITIKRETVQQAIDSLIAYSAGAARPIAALRTALQQAEQITHVAVEYEGKVWKLPHPNRHHHVIRMIGGINGPDVQGFVTSTGRFLNRSDAFKLAQSNGQLDRSWHPKNSYNGNELYSEDLWKSEEQAEPQAQAGDPSGCACRWDEADNRVQTCERHQGWLDVVHEWAERAKVAEQSIAEKAEALKACVDALEAGVSAIEAWRFAAMNQYRERPHTGETTQAMNAASTKAQEALK